MLTFTGVQWLDGMLLEGRFEFKSLQIQTFPVPFVLISELGHLRGKCPLECSDWTPIGNPLETHWILDKSDRMSYDWPFSVWRNSMQWICWCLGQILSNSAGKSIFGSNFCFSAFNLVNFDPQNLGELRRAHRAAWKCLGATLWLSEAV